MFISDSEKNLSFVDDKRNECLLFLGKFFFVQNFINYLSNT